MASVTVTRPSAADEIATILASPEVSGLIAELDALRWTGRRGYGCRSLLGACIAKALYNIPTWSRVAALIGEHDALSQAIGGKPSVYAMYRFAAKLRAHKPLIDSALDSITASLRDSLPEYGTDAAIDSSDLPAYANGQRFLSKNGPERERYSDPDASWGHRSAVSTRKGGGFYGYKLHAAVCTRTGLPLAWRTESASHGDALFALPLLDAVLNRGFSPETVTMDKGYDSRAIHDGCEDRGCRPVVAQIKQSKARTHDDVPTCDHGRWAFAGADFKRKATKWRCPTAECSPKSVWIKADRRNPLIPRQTKRFGDLYRGRSAVEREFGRLKHSYGLGPLRVRGSEQVALHANLCILARLGQALVRTRTTQLVA